MDHTATDDDRDPGGDGDAASPDRPSRPDGRPSRAWILGLLGVTAVALVLRLVYVFGWQAVDEVGGDAYYYHASANLLAEGEGFVHPFLWDEGVRAPGADHPPGYTVVLAVPSVLGFDDVRSHQVVTCIIGAATVALLGLVGRRVGGPRVGLVAAGFGAIYPNLWLNDASLMSESLALLLGTAVTLAAYQAWDRPSLRRFVVLGLLLGLATLVRAEAAMLVVLLVVPLCVWAPRLAGARERWQRGAVAVAVSGLVVAPWVVPNLFRFEHPATLSTQMGPTLEVANCDVAYYDGPIGGWSSACASELRALPDADHPDREPGVYRVRAGRVEERLPGVGDPDDRSELDEVSREVALDYMGEHRGRVPFVLAARFGRAWGLYAPLEQLKADSFSESRPLPAARVGLGLYYVAAVASVAGVVVLRRRGVPSFPLTMWVVNVTVTVVAFYGWTRFRAPAEPALVVLGAVGATALVDRLLRTRSGRGDVQSAAAD